MNFNENSGSRLVGRKLRGSTVTPQGVNDLQYREKPSLRRCLNSILTELVLRAAAPERTNGRMDERPKYRTDRETVGTEKPANEREEREVLLC